MHANLGRSKTIAEGRVRMRLVLGEEPGGELAWCRPVGRLLAVVES